MRGPAPRVHVQTMQVRGDRQAAYVVRWTVRGKPFSEGFGSVKEARSFEARLRVAAEDALRFSVETGRPESWSKVSEVTVANWVRQYLFELWDAAAPNSRRSETQALSTLVIRSATARATTLTNEQRQEVKKWLTPVWNATTSTWEMAPQPSVDVARWLKRYSPQLEQLDGPELRRIDLAMRNREDGTGKLGTKTQHRFLTSVRACIADAVASGAMADAAWPAKTKRGAKKKSERSETPTGAVKHENLPSMEKLRQVVVAMDKGDLYSRRMKAMTAVSGYAGLRPEETQALSVEDLDLIDEGWSKLKVTHAWVAAGERYTEPGKKVGAIKTEGGQNREVPVSPELAAELRGWMEVAQIDSGFLFMQAKGEPPELRRWNGHLKRACDEVDVVPFTCYGLRHCCASHWVGKVGAKNLAKVAKWLGNSIKILVDTYCHDTEDDESAIALLAG